MALSESVWPTEVLAGSIKSSLTSLPPALSMPGPMPTLYNGTAFDHGRTRPKLSIIELVLYNMAAMLAGFAAGYDVRISNVSPFHPSLQPDRFVTSTFLRKIWYLQKRC